MKGEGDTIAAIATAPGRGGVAVVRVSGPEARAVAARVTGRPAERLQAGRFHRVSFAGVDDGIVLFFKAPRSYTGEDVVEFQGHGGAVAPRRVLEAALAAGARLARRGEFTQRAFLNGRLDLSAAEAVIDLVDAATDAAADDALSRLNGALSKPFTALYDELVALSSALEHVLDVDADELPAGFESSLAARQQALLARIGELLATARDGHLRREGALVVLAGAPNAGKSSLMNALLGTNRAIVSNRAGTTRDVLEERLVLDGWLIRLTDTAGLRATDDAVEAEGVQRAEACMARADLVVALDCSVPGALAVHAKCDLDAVPSAASPEILRVSARTGEGLDALKSAIVARLNARMRAPDETDGADITTRQKEFLTAAQSALRRAAQAPDLAARADDVRQAAAEIGRMLGREWSEDILDALFSRFCVGK